MGTSPLWQLVARHEQYGPALLAPARGALLLPPRDLLQQLPTPIAADHSCPARCIASRHSPGDAVYLLGHLFSIFPNICRLGHSGSSNWARRPAAVRNSALTMTDAGKQPHADTALEDSREVRDVHYWKLCGCLQHAYCHPVHSVSPCFEHGHRPFPPAPCAGSRRGMPPRLPSHPAAAAKTTHHHLGHTTPASTVSLPSSLQKFATVLLVVFSVLGGAILQVFLNPPAVVTIDAAANPAAFG